MGTGFNQMDTWSKDALWKSLASSVAVSVPCFCLAVFLIEADIVWGAPQQVLLGILLLAACNFATLVTLEHCRDRIGALTIPSLLSALGLVVLFVIAEGINRFVGNIGYRWIFPLVAVAVLLIMAAIFREKIFLLKCHLGCNSVALAMLWSLGAADRISLPF